MCCVQNKSRISRNKRILFISRQTQKEKTDDDILLINALLVIENWNRQGFGSCCLSISKMALFEPVYFSDDDVIKSSRISRDTLYADLNHS